jgi:hypothetical protein
VNWAPLLLADPSPCLRWLVLRRVLQFPTDHPEVLELEAQRIDDPLASELLDRQAPDGSWMLDPAEPSPLKSTALALGRLGYLGLAWGTGPAAVAARRGAEYLFACQAPDGSWPLSSLRGDADPAEGSGDRSYDMVPLQTALPLRGLAACGLATDPRAERAYDWLLARRLEDGAWPTGKASGTLGFVAGYRRLPHSRWGCRSNTTGALLCLALHPERCKAPETRRALDLLLGRETRERRPMGFDVARLLGVEPARGFFAYFAHFDLALLLGLCAQVGVGLADERLASLVAFVREARGPFGLWEYNPHPQVSRWLTFDLLRSLSQLDGDSDWIGLEPRTPFQPYPPQLRRF